MLVDYLAPQYGPDTKDVQDVGADALRWLAAELPRADRVAADFYEEVR